jgi:hypothetical protein
VSRESTHDAGGGQGSDFSNAFLFQHARARFERRARRAHVVNQHDRRVPERPARTGDRESVTHIPMTPCGGQPGLRGRRAHALQRGDRRQADVARQVRCLIESALAATRVSGTGPVHAPSASPPRVHQRPADGPVSATFVLEGVNDAAGAKVVGADRGARDRRDGASCGSAGNEVEC